MTARPDLVARAPIDRRLAEIVRPVVEGMGFGLVRLRFQGGRKEATLQVMAERPDGTMEVEDCAKLSRALGAVLDVEDPIERAYSLEVSSPGIDRPLTRPQDFDRFAGWEAKLELEEAIEGQRRFRGVLQGYEDGEALLELKSGDVVGLGFELLADAKLVLTDELIAESLKGRRPGAGAEGGEYDPEAFDASEEETDGDEDAPKDREIH